MDSKLIVFYQNPSSYLEIFARSLAMNAPPIPPPTPPPSKKAPMTNRTVNRLHDAAPKCRPGWSSSNVDGLALEGVRGTRGV
jgi:hypothetical protein